MQEEITVWLNDIEKAIEEIENLPGWILNPILLHIYAR